MHLMAYARVLRRFFAFDVIRKGFKDFVGFDGMRKGFKEVLWL